MCIVSRNETFPTNPSAVFNPLVLNAPSIQATSTSAGPRPAGRDALIVRDENGLQTVKRGDYHDAQDAG
jgi:hypothetical protein